MNRHYQNIMNPTASLLTLCCLVISLFTSCSISKTNTCIDQERDALLKFKHDIQTDDCGLMSSWGNPNKPDCCTWKGVSCSNQSGHVIELHLSGAPYNAICLDSPVISPSLGELRRLQHLDLSSNYFYGMVIPTSIGTLINLVYLSLSDSGFSGNIPLELGNLTSLTSLDLSHNHGLSAKSLNWLSRLTSLRDINLSSTDLSKAKYWFRIIGSLPSLEILHMDDCQLSTPPLSSSSFVHSANLRVISLAKNNFNSFSSFQWLFNTSNYSPLEKSLEGLEHLDLSHNFLQGPIPKVIGNLRFLKYLDLSRNSLSRAIPHGIGDLDYLTHLDLSRNSLSNTIPDAIGNLEFLTYLDLSQNSLSKTIPDAISNLQSLRHLDLSNNSLSGPLQSTLDSSGSLGTMHSLSYLNLSYNRLEGFIPCVYNHDLEGFIPCAIRDSILQIDLSNNQLQGPIPSFVGGPSSLSHLDFSNNHLEGTIPASIANLEYLGYLDLSWNNLSGEIPCKLEIKKLPYFANFSNNTLSGSIPKYLSYLGPESFQGNPNFRTDKIQGLCDKDDSRDKDKIDRGLYVSIVVGFYTGFWGFCGILIVKSSWRHAYFQFFDHIKDKIYEIVVVNLIDQIYVIVAVKLARYRRNSQL